MKISRKDLPESIAKALEPRTFAQQIPEKGQAIEIKDSGLWFKTTYSNVDGDHLGYVCKSPEIGIVSYAPRVLWRPTLELEGEPQEPQRELPERDEYFIIEGRAAYRAKNDDLWRFITDEAGKGIRCLFQEIDTIPDNWQSLSDLIAKAAKAGELEAENASLKHSLQLTSDLANDWEKSSDDYFTKVEALQAKIKQQDQLLDMVNGVFNFTTMQMVAGMLEARRKAREASE